MICARFSSARAMASCALLVAALHAQRTFVVDSANGPGTTHLDMQPALLQSQRGDTIIVRPGNGTPYSSTASITHSLRIVAPGPVTPIWAARGGISIPAGDLVVIDNVRFGGPQPNYGFILRNCAGTVLLSRLYQGNVPGVDGGGIGQLQFCERVIYNRCRLHYGWGTAIWADHTNVYVLDCDLRSDFAYWLWSGDWGEIVAHTSSRAYVVNSQVYGGDYNYSNGSLPYYGLNVGGASYGFIAGRSTFVGGNFPVTAPRRAGIYSVAPLPGNRSDTYFVLDPLTVSINPPEINGNGLVLEMPTVSPADAIRGQPQRIDMIGPTNSVMALFVSLLTPRPPIVTDMGDIWLDPATTFLLGAGGVNASRDLVLNTTIPRFLAVGEVLVYQAAALSPTTPFQLSTPGFAVVQ